MSDKVVNCTANNDWADRANFCSFSTTECVNDFGNERHCSQELLGERSRFIRRKYTIPGHFVVVSDMNRIFLNFKEVL